jgi:hypothetical protein
MSFAPQREAQQQTELQTLLGLAYQQHWRIYSKVEHGISNNEK